MFAIGVILAAAAAVFVGFDSMGWAVFAAVVLAASLHRFFLPSRFVVHAEGIDVAHLGSTRRVRWREVRRFVHDERGGFLSTRSRASHLDAFRGTHLVWDANVRERAVEAIQGRLMKARGAGAGAEHRPEPRAEGRAAPNETGTIVA